MCDYIEQKCDTKINLRCRLQMDWINIQFNYSNIDILYLMIKKKNPKFIIMYTVVNSNLIFVYVEWEFFFLLSLIRYKWFFIQFCVAIYVFLFFVFLIAITCTTTAKHLIYEVVSWKIKQFLKSCIPTKSLDN